VTLANWQDHPYNRWSFQHLREVIPTHRISRGWGPIRPLEYHQQPLLPASVPVHRIDGAAETLVLAAADRVGTATRLGKAEIVPLPREGERLAPAAIRAALARRGLFWLFVEGGGVTVSRFLAAGALDRLQIALAPVILGSGRPSLQLPEIAGLSGALRPRVRHVPLGDDILIECILS
jgi:riboflavin biosynthesis pyrimidine reductase